MQIICFEEGLVINPFAIDENMRPRYYTPEKIDFTDHELNLDPDDLREVMHFVRSEEEAMQIADIFSERYGLYLSGGSTDVIENLKSKDNTETPKTSEVRRTMLQRVGSRGADGLMRIGSAAMQAGAHVHRNTTFSDRRKK